MSNTSLLQIGPKRNARNFVMSDFTIGQRLFMAGELIDACRNEEQERGFKALLFAAADAQTSAYLASRDTRQCRGVERVEADYADIRHGLM